MSKFIVQLSSNLHISYMVKEERNYKLVDQVHISDANNEARHN